MSALSKPVQAAVLGLAVLLLGLGGLSLYMTDGGGESRVGVSLAQGGRLYAEHCASCHGANLEGEAGWQQRGPDGFLPAPPHDASGHTWHHPDRQIFEITKQGTAALVGGDYKTKMRAFEGTLSDDEIWGILAYIKSRWPETIRARQAAITERAAAQ